jgi:hypothetical protein
VRQYSDLVEIVRTTEEFIAAAERVLNDPPVERIQRGIQKAQSCSWESTVSTMRERIKEAIAKPDRRSKRKIEPLSEAELEYHYQRTQGS